MNESDPKSLAESPAAPAAHEPKVSPPVAGTTQSDFSPAGRQSTSDRRGALSRWMAAGLVVSVIVIVALAATLRHQQQQLDDFGREASRRLDAVVAQAQAAQQQASLAQQTVQSADRRLTELEASARHLREQQQTLEQAWEDMVAGEEVSVLVDVEQSLLLASEQLQLAGRVPSAIAALQVAEARLSRAGRPAYRLVQQAVARDLKRLQSLPYQDFEMAIGQIDAMLQVVADFPLKAPGLGVSDIPANSATTDVVQGSPTVSQLPTAEAPVQGEWWQTAWQATQDWASRTRDAAVVELRRMVDVRRVDEPDALLLSADQADILRANITLRLIEARIALVARVDGLWAENLRVVQQAVSRYGDPASQKTRSLLRQIQELQAVDPAPELPTLDDSLREVRAMLTALDVEPVGDHHTAEDLSTGTHDKSVVEPVQAPSGAPINADPDVPSLESPATSIPQAAVLSAKRA